METQTKQAITKDMTMGEIIEKYPFASEIMLSYGLHCVGCHVNPYESLENGALGHGMSDAEITSLLSELNDAVESQKHEQPAHHGHKDHGHEEHGHKEHVEGNLTITGQAAHKVLEMMKSMNTPHHALRVAVVSGGCSGKTYKMDFDDAKEGDITFEQHGVKIIVDPKSMEFLNGTNIDYVESLQGSGFKLENPNVSGGCGCGKSVH